MNLCEWCRTSVYSGMSLFNHVMPCPYNPNSSSPQVFTFDYIGAVGGTAVNLCPLCNSLVPGNRITSHTDWHTGQWYNINTKVREQQWAVPVVDPAVLELGNKIKDLEDQIEKLSTNKETPRVVKKRPRPQPKEEYKPCGDHHYDFDTNTIIFCNQEKGHKGVHGYTKSEPFLSTTWSNDEEGTQCSATVTYAGNQYRCSRYIGHRDDDIPHICEDIPSFQVAWVEVEDFFTRKPKVKRLCWNLLPHLANARCVLTHGHVGVCSHSHYTVTEREKINSQVRAAWDAEFYPESKP